MRSFAHGLVDVAGVQLVHGHGTGCMLGVEVHRRAHPLIQLVWDWTGLDWIGLCCTGLDYTGLKLTLLDLTRCIAARPSSIRVVLSWPMSRPTARSRADLQHQGLSCAPSCAPISATSPGSSCSERASWCALARARARARARMVPTGVPRPDRACKLPRHARGGGSC